MKLLKNKLGFSLLELMIVAGMIGGMALTITKLGEMGNRSVKTNEYMFEKNSFVQEIERYLLNKDICEATFKGASLSGAPNEVKEIKSQAGRLLFEVGQVYGNRMVGFKSLSLQPEDPKPHANTSVMASVLVELEKIPQQAYGADTETRKFSIQLKMDGSEKVETCYSATDNAVDTARRMTCADFGGEFNEENNRCEQLGTPVKSAVCDLTKREFDEETQLCVPKLVEFDLNLCQTLTGSPGQEVMCPAGHVLLGLRAGTQHTSMQYKCCALMIP